MRNRLVQFGLSYVAMMLCLLMMLLPLNIVFSSWPIECLGFWCVAVMRYLPRTFRNSFTHSSPQNSDQVLLDQVIHANAFFVLFRTENGVRLLWRFMCSEAQFHRLLVHSLNTQWLDEKAGFKRY